MDKEDKFGDEVTTAFRVTTQTQRETVAGQWTLRFPYAALLKISPDALLVASLLEVGHESICNGDRPKAKNYGVLLKLALSYNPVDNSSKSVDNYA